MLKRKRLDLLLVFAVGIFLVIGCSLSERFSKEKEPTDDFPTTTNEENVGKKVDETKEDILDLPNPDSSNSLPVTLKEYNQLEKGMTYEQVVKILGSKGELLNSNNIGKYQIDNYRWKGDAKYSFVRCTFRDSVLSTKTQANLK